MELSSAPLHKGQLPWRGLLLAASLLLCWSSPAMAQLVVNTHPPHVTIGEPVLLEVYNVPKNVQIFYWYRGKGKNPAKEIARYIAIKPHRNSTGNAYTGRERISSNGFLFIFNVNQNDNGTYTIVVQTAISEYTEAFLQVCVHPRLPKPNITSNNYNPIEGKDSVKIMCEPETENISYLWRRNGQSLSEGDRLKLSEDNRTLTLLSVVRNDTGPYVCELQNPANTSRSDPLTLNIFYGPDVPIISPSNTHFHSRTNLQISCQRASHPPPLYSWFVNGEFQSSSQELVIPNITTKNSGSYFCFVYNSVTGLNRTTDQNIKVLEPVTTPSIQVTNPKVKEQEYVFLTCSSNDTGISIHWLFNGQSLGLTDRMKLPWNNSTLRIFPVKREDSGKYQCEVSNAVSVKRSDPIQLNIIYLGPSDNSPNEVDDVAYTVLNINGQTHKPPASASEECWDPETHSLFQIRIAGSYIQHRHIW
ncbi:carcinoembryonic antigen-related cell adhesion molecule 1-like [Chionomys nivalis]|uniref:carcinoembryonic antigen-related cell adhesion molecule 1-like n=1 Tax=Chionomys nivalis TaxID=269649 RepID=UPI00259A75BF|nr:carcinoembryonic antigen-related cell adhesion molecule 1-like [Chionomys nivalis]